MQTTFAFGNGALQNIFIGYYDARGVCTVVNDETEAGIAAVITILRLAGGLIAMIFQTCPRVGLLLSTTSHYVDSTGNVYVSVNGSNIAQWVGDIATLVEMYR